MASNAMRVRILGPVSVTTTDGDTVDLAGATTRALVAALAVTPGTRGAGALADDIWGDEPPKNPRAALQTLVSRLRSSAGARIVRSDPAGYALGVDPDQVDLGRARRLAAAAEVRDASDPDRLALVDEALALWHGEEGVDLGDAPVAGALRDAASGLRDRLETLRAASLTAVGRTGEAVTSLRVLTTSRPYDEALHGQLMAALVAAERAPEAIAVFADIRMRLRDDLGTSPGRMLTDLNTRLLRGDVAEPVSRMRIGLRAEPNELIGRAGDLDAIAARLTRSRLITVLGAGGLGKTRLAHAVAAASAKPAVVFVALASVRAVDDVPPAIAAALGVTEATAGTRLADARSRPDLRTRVVAALAERETLLVLDNCEQVIDGVAAWTSDMLDAVPALRVLATSRTPLAIGAEAVYPLAPLPTAAAPADPAAPTPPRHRRATTPRAPPSASSSSARGRPGRPPRCRWTSSSACACTSTDCRSRSNSPPPACAR